MKTLTGNKRYRTLHRCFRKPLLILQVEERSHGTVHSDNNGGVGREYDDVVWRDATSEDLTI